MKPIQQLVSELMVHGRQKEYASLSCFIGQGQIPRKIGIVVKGLFRYYYLAPDGKEYTKAFMPERSFISSYSAMRSSSPSYYSIEALEPSVVVEVSDQQWMSLRTQNTQWDQLLIHLLEKGYEVKEKRERELLMLDAQSRYQVFLEEYPGIEKRVKQYMVASYLGITPIALSRIRNKMGIINPG